MRPRIDRAEKPTTRTWRTRVLIGVGAATLAVGACSAEGDNPNNVSWTLRTGADIYDNQSLKEPCTTVSQESTVIPKIIKDLPGDHTIVEIDKSDPSLHLTNPDACSGSRVFTSVK
jgi:hypothetical protein